MPLKRGYGAYHPNWIISDSVFTKSLTSDNVLPVWRNQTLHIVTVLPGTDYFFCFQLGNTPSCWLFLLARCIWTHDLYLSYITRLGWRSSDCQPERICHHKAYVEPPAHRLLGGGYSWIRTMMWKQWHPRDLVARTG